MKPGDLSRHSEAKPDLSRHSEAKPDLSRHSEAKPDPYQRFVRWSDEDQCYIGYCPDLYLGGVCHGPREEDTYAELCGIVRDEIAHRSANGEVLPEPGLVHA